MYRSPPPSGAERDALASYGDPKGRLGSVTRKWNEIEALLQSPTDENRRIVLDAYQELSERVNAFQDSCFNHHQQLEQGSEQSGIKFADWDKEKNKLTTSYLKTLTTWMNAYPPPVPDVDVNDSASKTSKRSTTSSVRLKLLERRAELRAQEAISKEQSALELKRQELESKKRQFLLKELDDAISESQSQVSRHHRVPPVEEKTQAAGAGPLLSVLPGRKPSPTRSFSSDSLTSHSSQQKAFELFARAQERLTLLKNEPLTFDGSDCTLFEEFITNFDEHISMKCANSQERFSYLQKYTSGRALALVRSCQYFKTPAERYEAARKRLRQQYGDKYKIAQEYMKKIENHSPVRADDGQSLEDFATTLMSCKGVMEGISPLQQLNSPKEMLVIVMKLPYRLRERWRRKIFDWRAKEYEATFSDLAGFIYEESLICSTPMYENLRDPVPSKVKNLNTGKKKSFTTKTSKEEKSPPQTCLCCEKLGHALAKCFEFCKRTHEDRIAFIKKHRLCFGCLNPGHGRKYCKFRLKCSKCSRMHPTCLHEEKGEVEKHQEDNLATESTESEKSTEESGSASKVTCATSRCTNNIAKRILCTAIPVKVSAGETGVFVETYMALDGWSTDSFMDSGLLKKLGVKGHAKTLSLSTMGGANCLIPVKMVKNLLIESLNGDYTIEIPELYAKEEWPFTKHDSPKYQDIVNFPHLQNVPFQFVDRSIGLLIGMNVPELLEPQKTVSGRPGQPYATLHRLGWALNGPVGSILEKKSMCHRITVLPEDVPSVEEKLEALYSREFQEQDEESLGPSVEDVQWKSSVENSIRKLADAHYEIGLPFKDKNILLPSNYKQVYSRLLGKRKSLLKKPDVLKEYKDFMAIMLESGYAERVPEDQLETDPGRVWFLTHFEVRHKQKNKIRIVFDCSLKYRGVSLNDILYQGPDLTSGLLSVLLKFRQDKVAFMADIKQMFYQVKVPEGDSNFLRFLWYPDGDLERVPVQYRLRVHVFGAVSSPSCSNYALRRIADDNPDASDGAKVAIRDNFYVDDLVKSTWCVQEAVLLVAEVCRLLEGGGFELTGFVSNSKELLLSMPKERLSKNLNSVDLTSDEDLPYDRALGVTWRIQEDTLGFRIRQGSMVFSKRGILSAIFSVYDPFGVAIPVVFMGRLVFQETCQLKLQWDDALPPHLKIKWENWWNEIPLLNQYSIDRCYRGSLSEKAKIQLHVFADGSEKGYAAVAYLRLEDHDLKRNCSLVMAKARLVPCRNNALKTIPRIELNAAKLAVQLAQTIGGSLDLNLESTVFWSDSTTVLKYVSCETIRFQRFVANRVAFIRSFTSPTQWRYIPSASNPADLASRGTTASVFIKNKLWKFGPPFLREDEADWPIESQQEVNIPLDALECKKDETSVLSNFNLATITADQTSPTWVLLNSTSSWFNTKRRVAWYLRIQEYFRDKEWTKGTLTYGELKRAETAIFKSIQNWAFGAQIVILQEGRVLRTKDILGKLNPFMGVDGLLRVGGRQSNSSSSYDTKHPIILPRDLQLIEVLVREYHAEVGHLGREAVLSNLRTRFWILGASTLVRRVLRGCLTCRRVQGRPSDQIMADLPEERLSVGGPPFSCTGIDCFGPLVVKRSRGTEKRYGIVFTCLASRAIHLEVLASLTSDSFICAFRRFVSRRGNDRSLYSDNATNFVGACRELKTAFRAFEGSSLEPWCQKRDIRWKFNTPLASHQGGIWEREIRTVKKILAALLREQPIKFTDEALRTLMCEIENIMNSRPLTAISDDPRDLEPLTPNHLLLLHSGEVFPPGLFSIDDLYSRQRWKQVQYLVELFWTRFRKEYVSLLQSRQKWTRERRSHQPGDLVLLTDQCLPRNSWSLGRILEVKKSKDGHVRSATVKVPRHKSGKDLKISTTILERPITKLILLKSSEDLASSAAPC